ncbi:MAG TPA: hypothetical protein PKG80_03060, partial [Acidobacteriota bacterium]|nr:hypothetical protein [Acidobacteriota bacterium]
MTRPARKEEPKAPPLDAAALKRGLLAGLLAWLVPGLGHFYVGARRRAYAFCGLVVGSALLGVALDGNLAVYDARTPVLSSLQIVGGAAVGPWEPLLRGGLYGGMVYRGDDGGARRRQFSRLAALLDGPSVEDASVAEIAARAGLEAAA